MRIRIFCWCLSVCLLVAAGCLSPYNTRFPSLLYGSPSAERKSFEVHDPLPSVSEGPDTHVRPRGFEAPRSEARQAAESAQRRQLGVPAPEFQQPVAPEFPPTGNYPQSVPN